ncbi:MAG TPA: hypothetical protein VF309_08790, partial [Usitatibacter sp.]
WPLADRQAPAVHVKASDGVEHGLRRAVDGTRRTWQSVGERGEAWGGGEHRMDLQPTSQQATHHQLALGDEAAPFDAEVAVAHVPVVGEARIVWIGDGLKLRRG